MKINLVDVPTVHAVAIDGSAKPTSAEFEAAVAALYAVAYALRFALKADGIDEKVRPLEGLWDEDWNWTLFIGVPDAVDEPRLQEAVEKARRRKGAPEALARVYLADFDEGRVVEALHVGPYATEPDTVAAMDAFMDEHCLQQIGRHHEIYLSDPRRTKPEKLRTVLRHPVG